MLTKTEKKDIAKKFKELLNSFSKENRKTIKELIHMHDLMFDEFYASINSSILELKEFGYKKIDISFFVKNKELLVLNSECIEYISDMRTGKYYGTKI